MKGKEIIAKATYKNYVLNRAEALNAIRGAESMILESAGKYADGSEFYVIRVNIKKQSDGIDKNKD